MREQREGVPMARDELRNMPLGAYSEGERRLAAEHEWQADRDEQRKVKHQKQRPEPKRHVIQLRTEKQGARSRS